MASNQTQHYQLSQWEASDKVERLDFNADNAKIDGALHTMAEQVANKAENSAVSALTSRVNAKAEQSALTAEQTARQSADNAEQAARQSADNAEKAAREAADTALRNENCWIKLAETVLTQAASEVIMSVPNAGQLHKVLLEYSADGADDLDAYFLSQANLDSGNTKPSSSISLGVRNKTLAMGSINILRAGSEGRLAAFGRYLGTSYSFTSDGSPSFYSTTAILFQDLAAIRITADDPLNIGSRFVLYGMKR